MSRFTDWSQGIALFRREISDDELAAELERQIARYSTPHPSTPPGEPSDMKIGVFRRDDARVVLALGEVAYDFDEMSAYDLGNLLIDAAGVTPNLEGNI